MKMADWDLESIIFKDKKRKKKSLSIKTMINTARVFFSSKQIFQDYLLELSNLEITRLLVGVDNVFVSFYRCIYRSFEKDSFQVYKKWIERFILEKWNKPITHRNSFFSQKLIKGYPWITIEKACRTMRLAPSDLHRAIEDGCLLSVKYRKYQNTYTLVYRPNLLILGEYLTEIASFTRALMMLKITKKQLYEL